MAGDFLCNEKHATQICFEDKILVLPFDIQGRLADVTSRVVHQNINPAELFDDFGNRVFDALMIPNIQFNFCHANAKCFDFGGGSFE